ncbi:MAG: methyltransferase domain-containing protein [Nitrospirae bacterium]|nr:methyltransferase domain-containing protein [Nitrospirota bacterium]
MAKPADVSALSDKNDRFHADTSLQDSEGIRRVIREKYAEVAISAKDKFSYPTGKIGAETLGYDFYLIQQAPSNLLESFCGVGNPFSLGEIRPGARVLDFGCGAGFDLYVSGHLVGDSGLVCGVDLTREMIDRTMENLNGAGVTNYELKQIDAEEIPYPENFFDVVISNGVINLSPFKLACFREIYRILKPGGRVQFADVVLEQDLPAEMKDSLEAWSH